MVTKIVWLPTFFKISCRHKSGHISEKIYIVCCQHSDAQGTTCTLVPWFSLELFLELTRKRRNCWIKSLFCFLCTQKVFPSHHKIMVEPLLPHGLFYRCLYYLSEPWTCKLHCCQCRVRKLLDFIKDHLNLCFEDLTGFGTTWGWVIFIFGVNYPLKSLGQCCKFMWNFESNAKSAWGNLSLSRYGHIYCCSCEI